MKVGLQQEESSRYQHTEMLGKGVVGGGDARDTYGKGDLARGLIALAVIIILDNLIIQAFPSLSAWCLSCVRSRSLG